ncbi:MAG: prephenate dehydratase [Crocinitomicaceae bacterium]|nr:prephenate dehydratase [Crocinitomicaceae bacterium]
MRKHKIAIQGIDESFHHLAAQKIFGEDVITEHCSSFEDVCITITENGADYGVMAIENLLTGCILTNYYLIEKYGLNIIGETTIPISLHLIGLPGARLNEIEKVISHPIALAQCTKTIRSNGWSTEQTNDTATSVKDISTSKTSEVAAIANSSAAEKYGMEILLNGIQNFPENKTRFLVLSTKKVVNPKANKASISFQLEHSKGALAKLLHQLANKGCNVSKIQSIPLPNNVDQYSFIINIEWEEDLDHNELFTSLSPLVKTLKILGIYIKNTMIS